MASHQPLGSRHDTASRSDMSSQPPRSTLGTRDVTLRQKRLARGA